MQLLAGRLVYSASDLNNYLACEHLMSLDMEVVRGTRERPAKASGQAPLLAKLGEEHEQKYLQQLLAEGRRVTVVDRRGSGSFVGAALDTEAAMARGDDFIYQATFFHDGWLGHADFLRKVPQRLDGGKWEWHYEVEDTKLARRTEPYFLLQLAYYSEHVARIQGAPAANMHVVLGNGDLATFRVEDVSAYYRSVRTRFIARLAQADWQPYPQPVEHCGLCVWSETCEQRWVQDDHLSLVANITRLQVARLNDAAITTLHGLAASAPVARPQKMVAGTFERLHRQARLQEEQRIAKARGDEYPYRYEILASGIAKEPAADARVEPKRGFFRLPEPSRGDVFFDMEGDPYFDIGTGLEYMFGIYTVDDGFGAFWGCDRSEVPGLDRLAEKRAFEAFIDDMMARRKRDPGMHIYHYASYEKTALQKLSQRHATREDEVDLILREELLVDLYTVVGQAIAVGQPSYSIKKIEEFYGKRSGDSGIAAGDDSILRFEEWLTLRGNPGRRDDTILDDLERYNKYDCISTHGLREWLLTLRDEAAARFDVVIPPYTGKEAETAKPDTKFVELKAALAAKIPEEFDPESDDRNDAVWPFFLARHMLEYHWREDKPVHWRFHDRCDSHRADAHALIDDAESIIAIELDGEPVIVKKSIDYTFRFPPQFHKIEDGDCYDLDTKEKAGSIVSVQDGEEFGRLVLHRGPSLADVPLPKSITLRKIIPASSILDALARFGTALLDGGECRYRAAYDVLMGNAPRLRDGAPESLIQPATVDEASVLALCENLDDSYLFVQGPPGSGKTYLGARLIVDLLARGKRVGITANSHKAIHNLLDEVERVAAERDFAFTGLKKCTKGDNDTVYTSAHITSNEKSIAGPGANLVAGTAWAFGVQAMDQQLDYLFIDEAGQVALPHAVAVMTSAKSTILLGDPLQLPQVSHTAHPGDLGASVLEHVLDRDLRPVAPDRGVLLTDSYRMHPDVCEFISELLYEGRLRSAPDRERQHVASPGLSGTGLRYVPVEHAGNSQRSDEEAERIVHEIGLLLQGTVRDHRGQSRALTTADIIVVTPYNAQVRRLRRALDDAGFGGVEAGTVDKFQGREAFVVFFSTAASSGEEAPRGIGFIFDRQRFNVAISRARALAVMVGSPALLGHRAGSVEEVKVVNGVCRFLEQSLRL